MNLAAATEKQQAYIAALLKEREYDTRLDHIIIKSPADASKVIDILKAAPKKAAKKATKKAAKKVVKKPAAKKKVAKKAKKK